MERKMYTLFPHRALMATMLLPLLTLASAASAASEPLGSDVPTVKVTRVGPARVVVEVANANVSVRKEVTRDSSLVTITSRRDELQVHVARGRMVLSTPHGTVALEDDPAETVMRIVAVLQRSEAAALARTLLRQVPDTPRDFGSQTLALTRAVLEIGSGDASALASRRNWVEQERIRLASQSPTQPRLMRVTWQSSGSDRGPGDCWDVYAKEAIRIADDTLECIRGITGWFSYYGCNIVYIVRAEAAMAWFIACSGGFPFSG